MTDSANPVDLGETTNDAKGKIVFQISHPVSQAFITLHEFQAMDEDVVYDKLEAKDHPVVRKLWIIKSNWLPRLPIQNIIFNNKLVTLLKAKLHLQGIDQGRR